MSIECSERVEMTSALVITMLSIHELEGDDEKIRAKSLAWLLFETEVVPSDETRGG